MRRLAITATGSLGLGAPIDRDEMRPSAAERSRLAAGTDWQHSLLNAMTGEFDLAALEAMIAASAPPQTPSGVLDALNGLEARLACLDRFQTLAVLAGLQTDPAFGCNMVRLEMAMRLVLACSNGQGAPTRDKLPQNRTVGPLISLSSCDTCLFRIQRQLGRCRKEGHRLTR